LKVPTPNETALNTSTAKNQIKYFILLFYKLNNFILELVFYNNKKLFFVTL
jgi:hypothetical protein